ncbi:DUF4167 domain-containing protein [Telmatospirillum sp. J64-1]|uniref:DUF4167 domain-containing protein n=1 Tax=Telmatospirillum sp. J64-1 TaxID=2502183 RepID=UPI00115DBDC7|nr:DUF4167 domain-containing protein [Telmatospirillum sp. J64-1]
MKPGSPNSKQRPRGRNNGSSGGGGGGGGGGGRPRPSRNQTFDSNGPEVRIRGNAHQVLEKYLALARDASSQGDRIAAENFYQHAEHYYRLINSYPNNGNSGHQHRDRRPSPAEDQGAEAESEAENNDTAEDTQAEAVSA